MESKNKKPNPMHKSNKRNPGRTYPKNVTLTVPIIICGKTANGSHYDVESLWSKLDFLSRSGVFDMISIPIKMGNNRFYDRKDAKGMSNVGFVKKFNRDDKSVDITIYSNCAEKVKKLAPPAIFVHGVAYKEQMQTILTLEICEEMDYINLTKSED